MWYEIINQCSCTTCEFVESATFISKIDTIPRFFSSQGDFCTYSSADNHSLYASEECANGKLCECVHRLKVDTGSVVELIMIDEGRPYNYTNHPMHLHGHHFAVIGLGEVGSGISHWASLNGSKIQIWPIMAWTRLNKVDVWYVDVSFWFPIED